MSAPRFQAQLKKDSRIQLGEAIDMPIEEAWRIVRAYRTAYKPIPDTWYLLQEKLIPHMSEPGRTPIELGPVRFEHQAVRLPSGLRLHYPELRLELTPRGNEWMYRQGRKPSVRLFGGKLFENIVQALARIINTTAMLEMRRRFPKVPLALQSHDELVYVPSVHLAEELRAALLEIMARQPSWAPGLPLAAEAGKPGRSYGEVK